MIVPFEKSVNYTTLKQSQNVAEVTTYLGNCFQEWGGTCTALQILLTATPIHLSHTTSGKSCSGTSGQHLKGNRLHPTLGYSYFKRKGGDPRHKHDRIILL